MNKLINLAVITLVLVMQTEMGNAQQVHMYDRPPSAEEMGRILFNSGTRGSGTRGVDLTPKTDPNNTTTTTTQTANSTSNTRTGIGLPIEFDLNSFEIKPESKPFLYEVGKMMTSQEYIDKHLIIEGHTDARGSDQYNIYLSERRAHAISNFLTQNFGVRPSRLRAVGMGKYRPLSGRDPFDPVNRRVELYSASTN